MAAGPLIGGFVTTYWTWRYVFAGEVVLVIGILALTRKIADAEPEERFRLDLVGSVLSALGLGLAVYGVLRSGEWGWVRTRPGGPSWFGLSPTVWFVLAGVIVLRLFVAWEQRVTAAGREPLLRLDMLRNSRLAGGLTMFFFQFMIQAGLFFVIPLFLSVALGLSALQTGVRLLPLSVSLLIAAVGIPRFFPGASPREVVRWGVLAMLLGIVVLVGALEVGAGAEIVAVPLLLAGFGVGALASQLGAVTVSAVPDEQSGDVGGVQNTMTNLGASLGTAVAGSILIATLTSTLLAGLGDNPAISAEVTANAQVELAGGVPFVSDAQLETALDDAGLPPDEAHGDRRRERVGPDRRPAREPHGARPGRGAGALLLAAAAHAARGRRRAGARSLRLEVQAVEPEVGVLHRQHLETREPGRLGVPGEDAGPHDRPGAHGARRADSASGRQHRIEYP